MTEQDPGTPQPPQTPSPPAWSPPGTPSQTPPPPGWDAAGAPPYPGYGVPPPPSARTNGLAIAALVLGLIGAFPLAIIFGIVALGQIKRSGAQGKGLAIAGLVLGVVWMILVGLGLALYLSERAERDDSGAITEGGDVLVQDLEVGDCMNGLQEAEVLVSVDAVACADSHDAQLYATLEVPDGPWPGIEKLTVDANQRCADEMATNFQEAYEDETVELFFLHPTSASWREGDREIDCIALYTEPRAGSLLD